MNWTTIPRRELQETIKTYMQKSYQYYKHLRVDWRTNADHFENLQRRANQFIDDSGNDGKVNVGIAWMVVDGVISSMTDGRPKPLFKPGNKEYLDTAQALSRIMVGPVWEDLGLDEQGEDVLKSAMVAAGAAVTRPGLDFNGQLNDIFYEPQHVYPEPMVRDMQNMQFFGTQMPYPTGLVKRMFPDQANSIRSDNIEPLYDVSSFYQPTIAPNVTWNSDSKTMTYDGVDRDRSGRFDLNDRTLLTHVWLADYGEGQKPYDTDETDEEHSRAMQGRRIRVQWWENHVKHVKAHVRFANEIAAEAGFTLGEDEVTSLPIAMPVMPQTVSGVSPEEERARLEQLRITYEIVSRLIGHIEDHLSYPQTEEGLVNPHGVEVYMANDKVLRVNRSDYGNPYAAFQFDRSVKQNFWGRSLMHYLQPIDAAFNRLVSKIDRHADVVANGRCYYNSALKILWDKVKDRTKGRIPTGMYIPTAGPPSGNIMWDYGGNMPAYVFNLLGALEQWAYKIGGFTEVMQGSVPSYASGAAMGRAMQSAGVRIRKGVKHLGWYYRDKFRRYVQFMRYASPHQVFEILGKDNESQFVAWQDIEWDAFEGVRIEVRNMVGTWREEQYEKLNMMLQKAPQMAQIIVPAMAEYMDIPLDTGQVNREQQLENALNVMHDELGSVKAQMQDQNQQNGQK